MKILIIRHGDPDYEKDYLTEKGIREVNLLGKRLGKENITKIYCSPLGRARATAKPTADALGIEPVILDWLREFPKRLGQSVNDNNRCPWNQPPLFWTKFDKVYDHDNWMESELYRNSEIPEYITYVREQFDKLISQHGYTKNGQIYEIDKSKAKEGEIIAFFCHLGLGNCLLSHITGVPQAQWWHTIFLPTSSVTTVYMEKHEPEKNIAIGRLCGIGDTSHLYAGGEPVSSSGLHNPVDF